MSLISLVAQIPAHLHGLRLDQALSALFPEYSRARLQTWVQQGEVTVDEKHLRSKDKVSIGQTICIETHLKAETSWQPQNIALNVVYEDEALLVINKPVGTVVHPAAGNPDNTLVNALLHYASELENIPRAGVVHRLDKDTSGLLVVARNLIAHHDLVGQLQARTMKREYFAVVNGMFTAGGTIDVPIARHPRQRTKMAVIESGKTAVTHYRIAERFHAHTALQIFLETGRTHQIRVHMAHIGHPLVGDPTYGGRLKLPPNCPEKLQQTLRQFKRQALHAKKLSLIHPITKEVMLWEAPLPADIEQLLVCLRE